MNWKQLQSVVGIAALSIGTTAGAALAEGELFMYNWTDYTSPELIKKFEKEHDVKVTLDTFDSNETLLAKLKSGGTGYDIIVPGQNFIPVFIKEGLLQKIDASKLAGYQNIADDLVSPAWDAKNAYTIPWQWGTTTFAVNTAIYSGDIDTYKTLFEPPEELKGKIGMFKNAVDTVAFAQIYLGLPLCNESPDDMKKVLALLESQKPHVKVYNSDGVLERLVSGDTDLHQIWNGYTVRARKQKATIKYAFPREG
ncbi:MAG: spermidine/putrescine ABC transporter substrate-binding protein, partial [Blastopirellula sp.]